MTTSAFTALNDGSSSELVQVDATVSQGFPGIQLIGNTSELCRDGKERVRAALDASGIRMPLQKFLISLSPGDLRKDGNHYDLPMAIALVQRIHDKKPYHDVSEWLFAAELGLDGALKPCKGIISVALAAIEKGKQGIVVGTANLRELSILSQFKHKNFKALRILGFDHLKDLIAWFYSGSSLSIYTPCDVERTKSEESLVEKKPLTFADMILNSELEDAAIAIAGGRHSALLRGSPGSGKTMFAERLPSILPGLEESEHLHLLQMISGTQSVIPEAILDGTPPFRRPHHQSSSAAILGNAEQPGELSLAHGGILFLDELAEFRRDVLEALREPMESGRIHISRSKLKKTWPAKSLLIAASNNCPCGWAGSKKRRCKCSSNQIIAYVGKLSGPVLDRIDIHINMPEEISHANSWVIDRIEEREKRYLKMKDRVVQCRKFQEERLKHTLEDQQNVSASKEESHPDLLASLKESLDLAIGIIPASASRRSAVRCCKLARTLADMEESFEVKKEHLARAWKWQAESAAKDRGEDAFHRRGA